MTQPIKRVLVSLDAVSESDPAIDTAARLAARWQVPLHGVFVEDEELIGFAGLPFARQVCLATGLEPFTKDHIENHFRAFAERLQRELAAAAARHGVESSFEVVRGPLAAAGLGGEHDFVVAGAATRPVGEHFRIASRWWSSTAIIARPFLLAKRQWETGGSVFALLHRCGPESARILEIAAQIAGISRATLTVAGPPGLAGTDEFAAWVSGLLEGHSVSFQTESAAAEPAALRQRIIELDCRLLAIEASPEEPRPEELREFIEPLACDLLVVR
jgi:nucleotide-binding universal stress UspA family protein